MTANRQRKTAQRWSAMGSRVTQWSSGKTTGFRACQSASDKRTANLVAMLPLIVVVLLSASCGDDAPPTAPAPTVTYEMRFSEMSLGEPQALWMSGPAGTTIDEIPIAVNAWFTTGCPAHRIQTTVTFNSNYVRFLRMEQGAYLRQGGVSVAQTLTQTGTSLTFTLTRPMAAAGVAGQGVVATLVFGRAAGATRTSPGIVGESDMAFASTTVWGDGNMSQLCAPWTHGGEITVLRQ